jgi:uroporphyrinogen-III decarboxylase
MISSRDRLLAALRHEEADFVPNNPRIWAWLIHHYGDAHYRTLLKAAGEFDFDPVVEVGLGLPNPIYTQIDDYQGFTNLKVELKISQQGGVPYCRRTLFTPAGRLSDTMCYPPAGAVYGIQPDPEKREYLIKEEADLEKIRYLLPDPQKYVHVAIGELKRETAGRALLQMRPTNGVDHLLVDSVGMNNTMLLYYDNPGMLKSLIKIYADYYRRCIECTLAYEPDIVFDSWYSCSLSTGWSPQMWAELFYPHMKANRELVRNGGAYYHYYDDGKIMGIVPYLKELQPDILSTLCPPPAGDADLAVLKQELGHAVCLNGNVDLQTILRGTPEQVEEAVRQAVLEAGSGGGFWLGTSDSIRDGSPLDNVKAYFQAARKYGKYQR